MASSRDYLEFILAQLSQEDVAYRAMMGEYVLYYRGKSGCCGCRELHPCDEVRTAPPQ